MSCRSSLFIFFSYISWLQVSLCSNAVLYRYRATYLGQDVAVKILKAEKLNEAIALEFNQEVEILRWFVDNHLVLFILYTYSTSSIILLCNKTMVLFLLYQSGNVCISGKSTTIMLFALLVHAQSLMNFVL